MWRLVVIISVLVLGSCATAAQRQAVQSRDGLRMVTAEYKACAVAVRNSPEYAPLLPHMSDPDSGQPTMAQLTDGSTPTAQEASLVASFYDATTPCRSTALHGLSVVRPDLAPIVASAYTTRAAATALLVQRKITWGEAAQRAQVRVSALRQALEDADHQWLTELRAENREELAQRQAAGAALANWAQQQQMINAINRPVITNCNQWGSTVNCVSH